MDKPTTNWPGDSAICGRPDGSEATVVPSTKFPRDGEWCPENAALQQAADASSADLAKFYREQQEIEIEIRRYERRYQETREPIARDDADRLAKRIKNLRLPQPFDGRDDYIAFLAGQCLTLKEGKAAGEVYTATARLEATGPADRAGQWLDVTLAIPAALQVAGPNATLGVQTVQWLYKRCETLARKLAIRGFPPDSPAARMFDGGGFAFTFNPGSHEQPEPESIPFVLAPDEATIAEYIERAASHPDYWDALACVADVLNQCGQSPGVALGTWIVEVLPGRKRPDLRKAAKAQAKALRNHAIIAAVRALERCGMRAMTNDREPGPACDAVAEAFSGSETLRPKTVLNIWKSR